MWLKFEKKMAPQKAMLNSKIYHNQRLIEKKKQKIKRRRRRRWSRSRKRQENGKEEKNNNIELYTSHSKFPTAYYTPPKKDQLRGPWMDLCPHLNWKLLTRTASFVSIGTSRRTNLSNVTEL